MIKNVSWSVFRKLVAGLRQKPLYCLGCGQARRKAGIKSRWFFVRHGETDWNVEKRYQGQAADTSLNQNGVSQARNAGQFLKKHKIDLIISSDLLRAKQTAEIIGGETNTPIFFDHKLRERRYGVFDGLTVPEIHARGLAGIFSRIYTYEFIPPPDGESIKAVEERVHEAVLNHKTGHGHKNVVLVSHGAAIRYLIKKLKRAVLEEVVDLQIQNGQIVGFFITADPCRCGSDFAQ